MSTSPDDNDGTYGKFAPRELEVLHHIAHGYTYAAIAHKLKISPHTVDTYVRRIKIKADIKSYPQLLILATGGDSAGSGHNGDSESALRGDRS
ncbi:helix-turn-helix transcriptional regulator [Amycolatopsis sp. NBC_00345]|uniref:response regulator transcription factor n=1 Tax=Amycolatopsis sp. NBC_00345 TaxID=2975955 RepID=UPI002E25E13C